MSDAELFLRAILIGVARWEPMSRGRGEVCTGGLRYATHLDYHGIPVLTVGMREALENTIRQKRMEEQL